MNSRDDSKLWTWFLLRRVLSYGFWGGASTAAAGTALLGVYLWWALPNQTDITIIRGVRTVPLFGLGWSVDFMTSVWLRLGLWWAALCFGFLGCASFALVGFFSRPNRRLLPPSRVLVPTLSAMVLASLVAMTGSVVVVRLSRASVPPNLWWYLGSPGVIVVSGLVLIAIGALVGLTGGLKLEKAENHG